MTYQLETAAHPETLRRVAIDPVSRVEGHGKVTLLLDDQNKVHQVRLHIVEFRGFEKFIQGRPYWEVPVMVQRLCGICPVSHHLAASKAMDVIERAKEINPKIIVNVGGHHARLCTEDVKREPLVDVVWPDRAYGEDLFPFSPATHRLWKRGDPGDRDKREDQRVLDHGLTARVAARIRTRSSRDVDHR